MKTQEELLYQIKELSYHVKALASPVQNDFKYLIRDGMPRDMVKEIEQDFYKEARDIQEQFNDILAQAQELFGKVLYHYDDIKEYKMEEIKWTP